MPYIPIAEARGLTAHQVKMINAEEIFEIGRKEGWLTEEIQARLEREQIEGEIIMLQTLAKYRPQALGEILAALDPTQIARNLTPEQRKKLIQQLLQEEEKPQG